MVEVFGVYGTNSLTLPRAGIAAFFAFGLMIGATQVLADELDELEDDPFADYAEEVEDTNDPFEIPNRFILAANQAVDAVIVRPAAVVYRDLVPQYLRDRIRNVLRNLRSPIILANDLLQGEWERAGTTTRRFVINSVRSCGLKHVP